MGSRSKDSIEAFYDDSCSRCRHFADWAQSKDKEQSVHWRPLSIHGPKNPRIDAERAQKEIPIRDAQGQIQYGFEALYTLSRQLSKSRSPALKTLHLALKILRLLRLGHPLYALLARTRNPQ